MLKTSAHRWEKIIKLSGQFIPYQSTTSSDIMNKIDKGSSLTYTHLSSPHGYHLTGNTSENTRCDNVLISRTATVENQYNLVPWLELVQNGLLAEYSQLLCWQADKKAVCWSQLILPYGHHMPRWPRYWNPTNTFKIYRVSINWQQAKKQNRHRPMASVYKWSWYSKVGVNVIWSYLYLHSHMCALEGGSEHALKSGFDPHHHAFCFNMTEKMSSVYLWVLGTEGTILFDIWRVTPWK